MRKLALCLHTVYYIFSYAFHGLEHQVGRGGELLLNKSWLIAESRKWFSLVFMDSCVPNGRCAERLLHSSRGNNAKNGGPCEFIFKAMCSGQL